MSRVRSIALMGTALCSGMFDNMPWMGMDRNKKANTTDGAGGDPANSGVSGGGNTPANDGKTKTPGQNDTPNDASMVDDIWKQVKDGKEDGDPADGKPNGQQPNNAQTDDDPQKKVDAYMRSIGLEPIALSDEDVEAFKNGDNIKQVIGRINANIQTAHIKAVTAANEIIKQQLPKMVEEAVNKSKNIFYGERLRDVLRADPKLKGMASDPVFAPVVESIFKQFTDKGASQQQAITATQKYFERMAQKWDPNAAGVNTNTGGAFRRTPQSGADTDFLDLLRGQ